MIRSSPAYRQQDSASIENRMSKPLKFVLKLDLVFLNNLQITFITITFSKTNNIIVMAMKISSKVN